MDSFKGRPLPVFILMSSFILAGLSAGCSSARTNIFARDNGTYMVVSSSSNMDQARKAAREAAAKYCRKMGKHFLSQNDGDPSVAEKATDQRVPDTVFTHGNRDNSIDYSDDAASAAPESVSRVKLNFRCI